MQGKEILRIREKLGVSKGGLAIMTGLDDADLITALEDDRVKAAKPTLIMLRLLDTLPIIEARDLSKIIMRVALLQQ